MNLPPLVEPGAPLTRDELERYSRHVLLPALGTLGQRRLKAARVLVIGAGGLGSPVLVYLAAAGIGTIGIVDDDVVDVSNLQRQVIHGSPDVGQSKVASAAQTLLGINPFVDVVQHAVRLSASNARELFAGYDLVIDGTDTFATRYLISDAAALQRIPCIWGSVFRFDGQVSVFWSAPPAPALPVTYRDLHPVPPPPGSVPSCAEGGVLGAVCAAIGSAMATEAIKLICGIGSPLLGRVSIFDALDGSWSSLGVRRAPGAFEVTALDADYDAFCGLAPTAGSSGPAGSLGPAGLSGPAGLAGAAGLAGSAGSASITVTELAMWLAERDRGERDFVLIDVREPFERELATIPGSVLIPLGQLRADVAGSLRAAGALREGDAAREGGALDRTVVLHCKSGARSAQAQQALRAAGYAGAVNVEGGVLAWIDQIDPSQPRY